jgi:hypothetical protein
MLVHCNRLLQLLCTALIGSAPIKRLNCQFSAADQELTFDSVENNFDSANCPAANSTMKPFAQAMGELRALGLDNNAPTVESAPSAVRYLVGDDPESNPMVFADAPCFGPNPGESMLAYSPRE